MTVYTVDLKLNCPHGRGRTLFASGLLLGSIYQTIAMRRKTNLNNSAAVEVSSIKYYSRCFADTRSKVYVALGELNLRYDGEVREFHGRKS
jgi:hypothetical protein